VADGISRRHIIKSLIKYRLATNFSLKKLFVNVVQRFFFEVPTKFLHVMQGFGRRFIIKLLNKYQFVMQFKFFLSLS
jgi:hypothetical protein